MIWECMFARCSLGSACSTRGDRHSSVGLGRISSVSWSKDATFVQGGVLRFVGCLWSVLVNIGHPPLSTATRGFKGRGKIQEI